MCARNRQGYNVQVQRFNAISGLYTLAVARLPPSRRVCVRGPGKSGPPKSNRMNRLSAPVYNIYPNLSVSVTPGSPHEDPRWGALASGSACVEGLDNFGWTGRARDRAETHRFLNLYSLRASTRPTPVRSGPRPTHIRNSARDKRY